jgi:hypothetical protein
MTDLSRPAIAAAIIVSNGHVLLVRRRLTEGSLSWQFPAGEVEPGETAEQAAVGAGVHPLVSPLTRQATRPDCAAPCRRGRRATTSPTGI